MGLMGLVLTTNEGDTDDDLEDDTYMDFDNEKTPTNAAPGPSTGPSKKRGRMAVGAVLKTPAKGKKKEKKPIVDSDLDTEAEDEP
jgi:hypothetical protein